MKTKSIMLKSQIMIKCDLHIHSYHSFDSLANPKKIVDVAIKRGLNCIAIADHGNINGSLEALDYVQKKSLPIIIIIAEEIKSKSGDILAFGISKAIPNRLPVAETLGQIRLQSGLAIIAHPYGSFCGFKENLEKYLGQFDGIETFNASVFWGNARAQEFAKKHDLATTAGSDAHFTNQFIGKVWLELPLDYSPNLTQKQVIAAIKNKTGVAAGTSANFFEKSLDHSFRSLTKLKALFNY